MGNGLSHGECELMKVEGPWKEYRQHLCAGFWRLAVAENLIEPLFVMIVKLLQSCMKASAQTVSAHLVCCNPRS
jgi:hypothetical protein